MRKFLVASSVVLATVAGGVTEASAASGAVVGCTTGRASDGSFIQVSCDRGRYYVVGTACNVHGCTDIGGSIVSSPNVSRAYAGPNAGFVGDVRMVWA